MKEYFEKIFSESEEEFHKLIENKIENSQKSFIVTANPETLMIAEENEEFKKSLLDENTIIVPDGIGVIKGMQMLKYKQSGTITGVELAKKLIHILDKQNGSLFLFGAKDEVVKKLKEKINSECPNVNIVGCENGYGDDKQKVFDEIVKCSPDVTLVALGIPQQELLIYNNLDRFEKGIFVGVGGSFDVLSGMKKRAPKFFIKFHLEWLYRICREPKRMGRFFKSNVRYLFKIMKEK